MDSYMLFWHGIKCLFFKQNQMLPSYTESNVSLTWNQTYVSDIESNLSLWYGIKMSFWYWIKCVSLTWNQMCLSDRESNMSFWYWIKIVSLTWNQMHVFALQSSAPYHIMKFHQCLWHGGKHVLDPCHNFSVTWNQSLADRPGCWQAACLWGRSCLSWPDGWPDLMNYQILILECKHKDSCQMHAEWISTSGSFGGERFSDKDGFPPTNWLVFFL